MNGAELAARYAFPPNGRGYCGPPSFHDALESNKPLEPELKKFNAHYAYLSLIARENNMQPFDHEVVRAFWTGNSLLDNVSSDSLREFIRKDLLANQPGRAERLSRNMPDQMTPHHSFNSLYINFVSDAVPRTMESYDLCCVTPAEVLSVSEKTAVLKRYSVAEDLTQKTETADLEQDGMRFCDDVEKGDIVSVHWGMIIEKITKNDSDALLKYTKRNLDALRS